MKDIKKLVEELNTQGFIILGGLKNSGKKSLLKEMLIKTNTIDSFFYFDKNLDTENKIQNEKDIKNLLNIYSELYKKPKIIILENINKIENIKKFISFLYQETQGNKKIYKTILLGNNIKIEGVSEIEISSSHTTKEGFEDQLINGNLRPLDYCDTTIKKQYINIIKNDILLNDIFRNFSVKNIDLYNITLSYLAKLNAFISLRELQKNIDARKSISLKTVMDYIDFSLQAKLLRKMYKYDLKNKKLISTQVKYFFSDVGIRNSFTDFEWSRYTNMENLLFNELYYLGYDIYGGMNGKFDFSFRVEKHRSISYIHISQNTDKEEIKKEARKLLKIGDENKKFLLVENLKETGIKKRNYENLEILEFADIFEKLGQGK